MPAESYGLFLSQYAIRVEKIRAVIALRSAPAHQPQGDHLHDIVLLPLIQRLPWGMPCHLARQPKPQPVGLEYHQ